MPRPLGLAFSLADLQPDDQGSVEVQPVCAARCEPMSRIQDHVWIGSWRDIEEPDAMRAAGITHVLNVAKEVDPTHHEESMDGFAAMHIPLADEHRENIIEHLEAACSFIEEAKASGGKCLVHCRRGISRSPAIVVGYLMRQAGFEYDAAVAFVKDRRHCVSLNIAFREFLMSYETPHVLASQKRTCSHTFDDDTGAHPTPGTSEGDQGESAGHSVTHLAEPSAQSPPTE